jgi:hypothetical protein
MRQGLFVLVAASVLGLSGAAQAADVGGWVWAFDSGSTPSYDATTPFSFNSAGGRIRVERHELGRYTVTFEGLVMGPGNAQVVAYGPGNKYCNVASWGGGQVRVQCFSQWGSPADSQFVVSLVDRLVTAPDPAAFDSSEAATAYVWVDRETRLSSLFSFNSTGGANSVVKRATGEYEVVLDGVGSSVVDPSTRGEPMGRPIVTAYGTNGYCVARLSPRTRSSGNSIVRVACFDAAGNDADSAFSLIVSKSRHMLGSAFAQFWNTDLGAGEADRINGIKHNVPTQQNPDGWTLPHFAAQFPSRTMTLVSSCGLGATSNSSPPVYPDPQRAKIVSWLPEGNGVRIRLGFFNRFGLGLIDSMCYNAAYSTTQTAPTVR